MGQTYFTPATFKFLNDLKNNNDRDWFKANQDRYEQTVRQPALDFITDFAEPLAKISPHFVADSRTVGGSLFRIHRDTRFSKDKTPYKLNTGMQFRHEMAKDVHAPGFYVHLEPRNCFIGIGLWRPETKVAYQIRGQIDAEQAAWKKAAGSKGFATLFDMEGDSLQRPPKGFDADHPLIKDLKRKDFIASSRISQADVASPGFMKQLDKYCKVASPYMRFLCEAIEVPF